MAVTTSASIAPPPGLGKLGVNEAAKKEADHDLAALPFGQLLQGLADGPQAEAPNALAALAQLAAATPGASGAAKKEADHDLAALPFGQLLQGLADDPQAEAHSALAALAQLAAATPGAKESALDPEALLNAEAAGLLPGAVLGLEHLQTLVGQTLRLDTQADRLQREGSSTPLPSALLPAQSAMAKALASGETPAVALGVQSAGTNPLAAGQALVVDAQQGQMEAAAEDAQSLLGTAQAEPEVDTSAGKLLLQTGVWQLVSPSAAAPAAALLGHMGQWATQWLGSAGGGGMAGKNSESANGSKNTVGLEALLSGGGTGQRLTEQAVQASTASQNAQNNPAPEPQAQENLRFWLQGDQQRGEVVVQRDGKPLRVQVQMRGNQAHVVFRSDEAEVRTQLDAGLAQLGDLLAQQGLALAGAQVQPEAQPGQSHNAAPYEGQAHQGRVQVAASAVAVAAENANTGQPSGPGQLNVYV